MQVGIVSSDFKLDSITANANRGCSGLLEFFYLAGSAANRWEKRKPGPLMKFKPS